LVHLSVPAWTHSSKPTAACLLLWARQAGDIDQLLSGMQQQQWQANLGSVTLSAYCRETLRQIDSPVMCRKLAVYDRWTDLVIHTAMDNCVIIDDICKFCLHLLTILLFDHT